MNKEMMALSIRARDCVRWRWLPGMAGMDALGVPFRLLMPHHSGGALVAVGASLVPAYPESLQKLFPDLDDPATLGCITQLVRDSYGDPEMFMVLGGSGWVWLSGESRVADVILPIASAGSIPEALINALE
jgi:hypothetical protein